MPRPDDMAELERALTRISHMLTRAKQHDRTVEEAGVAVDRASAPLLRALADASGPLRLGELAERLAVEAPHVTRQVQRLERTGFVERVPDPDDRRAQRVRITARGADAVECIRAVGRRWMSEALTEWSDEDRHSLAALCHRMVDDFERSEAERRESGRARPV
ncbi:MarR family transcriptional regulator [Actinoallomurus purpureus]|uniref:MarR family winged helix-turn-helix transcriptional regulator n=1 Tax=Actinoallomurus purpureus TaxID=478114 RepID=UPI002093DC3A|nr:MarR family transcriptional regulator [Actinoallomurus purpureus]MCO6007833.1 MarR family transcriptional regulator [Actinoallomurus purpureus]